MWETNNNQLYRKFKFKNFSEAFAFMVRVAIEAEKADHRILSANPIFSVQFDKLIFAG